MRRGVHARLLRQTGPAPLRLPVSPAFLFSRAGLFSGHVLCCCCVRSFQAHEGFGISGPDSSYRNALPLLRGSGSAPA